MAPRSSNGSDMGGGGRPRTPPSSRGAAKSSSHREDSEYDSEDDEGPTIFGSMLRTVMAGAAVVAIAVLVSAVRVVRAQNF